MKKKILIIHHCGLIGGAGISLYALWKGLKKHYDVTCYIPDSPQHLNNYFKGKGLNPKTFSFRLGKLTYYSGGNNLFSIRFWYHALNSLMQIPYWNNVIKKENPDLVIVNSMVLCWMLLILKNRKSLCFVRETMLGHPKKIMNKVIYYLLNSFTLVAFLSVYDLYKNGLRECDTVVSPDFLEPSNYMDILGRSSACDKFGLDKDCFNVLFVGGVNKLKGIDLAVKAIDFLKHENITLVVAGEDSGAISAHGAKFWVSNIKRIQSVLFSRKIKKFITNKKITAKIKFIGIQTDMSVPYSACDVLIFPMKEPHQARPAFEIGVQKKTVIITDYPNISEFVVDGYNGLTFEKNNPKALAHAIMRLKNNEILIKDLGMHNYEYTMRYHTETYAMGALIDKINSILV